MSVTLTATYKEFLKAETVEYIESKLDEYELRDILEFIDENSEEELIEYYDLYIEQGECIGYDVVDSYIEEFGISELEHCEERFVGYYDGEADFAEDYTEENYDLPDFIVVDWLETFDRSLQWDYVFVAGDKTGFVFRKY